MKYRPLKWYFKYKWPRKLRYHFRQVMGVIGICLIGFGIGTFYPNFLSKHNIEEKAVDKTVLWAKEIGFAEPKITIGSDDEFIKSMQRCIAYLNLELHKNERVPDELIIAQAIIESNAGLSRFAREGNNLFGIRVWNKDKGMLPHGYGDNLSWRVKSYPTKCASVRDYLKILNTKGAYTEFRKIRDRQNRLWGKPDGIELAKGLDNWSTTKDYEQQVINIIKRLRQDGKVVIKR
jgi:flagellum-specific peptidoglycan hydrolase FlgJ